MIGVIKRWLNPPKTTDLVKEIRKNEQRKMKVQKAFEEPQRSAFDDFADKLAKLQQALPPEEPAPTKKKRKGRKNIKKKGKPPNFKDLVDGPGDIMGGGGVM